MSLENEMNLYDYIVDVPDWPKEGVVFKDITPLLKNANALNHSTLLMRGMIDQNLSYIVGCEARGFIFGSYLAKRMGTGFIPVRKKGKLIIVDDVYATGGTAKATRELCKEAGYEVVDEIYLINLSFLNKDKVKSVLTY